MTTRAVWFAATVRQTLSAGDREHGRSPHPPARRARADPGTRRRLAHSLPAPPFEARGHEQRAEDAAVDDRIVPLEIDLANARHRDVDGLVVRAGRSRVFDSQPDLIAWISTNRPLTSAAPPASAMVRRSPRSSGAVKLAAGRPRLRPPSRKQRSTWRQTTRSTVSSIPPAPS